MDWGTVTFPGNTLRVPAIGTDERVALQVESSMRHTGFSALNGVDGSIDLPTPEGGGNFRRVFVGERVPNTSSAYRVAHWLRTRSAAAPVLFFLFGLGAFTAGIVGVLLLPVGLLFAVASITGLWMWSQYFSRPQVTEVVRLTLEPAPTLPAPGSDWQIVIAVGTASSHNQPKYWFTSGRLLDGVTSSPDERAVLDQFRAALAGVN